MPARNVVKIYVENGYYHLLQRGVEKRQIFMDRKDYVTFLSYLKRYLTNPDDLPPELHAFRDSNLHEQITLVAYCLMPNHYHLLVKQSIKNAITKFTRSLGNAYVRYFNTRHNRIGGLFQGKPKGIIVDNDTYLLHLSRYIHCNPSDIWQSTLYEYPYSSYADYLGLRNTEWVHPNIVLDFFKSPANQIFRHTNTYVKFVEDLDENSESFLEEITLE
jgi:putative transposase